MLNLRLTKSLRLVCMMIAFFACTTKNEVPQPVVDTARVDALRAQLMALQQQVLGAQQKTSGDSVSLTQMQAEIVQLEAEIATLQADLQRVVSYTITVNSFLRKPLAGATVKLSQGGKIVSAITGSNGSATFPGLYAGIVTATVDLNGFARLVFRADIRNSLDASAVYSANSKVLMIPLGGTAQADSCMTTQYWTLYANYSMVDDTLGGVQYWPTTSTPGKGLPAGPNPNSPTISYSPVTTQPVTAYLNQYSFIDGNNGTSYAIPIGFTGWDVTINNTGQTGNGQVLSVSYENVKWTATANANGVYTINLPASDISNSNNSLNSMAAFAFILDFGEFTHDYTQYTDPTITPFIIKNPATEPPTYTSTYIYYINYTGGQRWLSIQSTTLTAAWPFFFSQTMK